MGKRHNVTDVKYKQLLRLPVSAQRPAISHTGSNTTFELYCQTNTTADVDDSPVASFAVGD